MNDDVDGTVSIVSSKFAKQSFSSASSFTEWLRDEVDAWEGLLSGYSSVASDPISDLGLLGAQEHAGEFRAILDGLLQSDSTSEEEKLAAARRAADIVGERFDQHALILSSSPQGLRIRSLATVDPAAANLIISLYSGRNITRVISPQNLRSLWRGVARISSGAASDDVNLLSGDIEAASEDLRRRLAETAAIEREVSDLLMKARAEVEHRHQVADAQLRAQLAELKERSESVVSGIRTEWDGLRALYDSRFAFEAPVKYWSGRRNVHRLGAVVWGAVATIFSVVVLTLLVPAGADSFQEAREVIRWTKASPGPMDYLPEIFQVAVLAFLSLWALRFMVRQVSEHLARGEEASQRVTMAETFLALSNPGEGKAPLVGEADRAVIVQALFRPSAHSGIDDAPPAHWVEDVFRRIKGGEQK